MSGTPQTPWTPVVIAMFLELVNAPDNFSYREIARRLTERFGYAFTKNACIGKAGRLALPAKPRKPAEPREPKVKPLSGFERRYGVPIHRLEPGHCRFLLTGFDNQPPYQYCGRRVIQEGGSWCVYHFAMVYNRRTG